MQIQFHSNNNQKKKLINLQNIKYKYIFLKIFNNLYQ
jgi:hypothetical protein